ncbi:hypothetical protein BHE74_00021835 [Ensete ventricosum]|nr:hypothetical protein BHE74_00021835 [Ensete ventricosum]RZS23760.1 hypothetical protein BHM03_00056742 [Ensete ventricosum]
MDAPKAATRRRKGVERSGEEGGWQSLREVGDQVVKKDGSLQPGQVQPRAQPLPTSKRSKATRRTHVPILWGRPMAEKNALRSDKQRREMM